MVKYIILYAGVVLYIDINLNINLSLYICIPTTLSDWVYLCDSMYNVYIQYTTNEITLRIHSNIIEIP